MLVCGRPNRLVTRLENGEFAQAHEFPWLAAIILNGTRLASGALINDRYVLTAFSPLAGLTPYQIKVTLGANDRCRLDTSSANVSVSDIIPLPNYDERTGAHDIALLKLTSPVTFNMNVNPICLPDTSEYYTTLDKIHYSVANSANASNEMRNLDEILQDMASVETDIEILVEKFEGAITAACNKSFRICKPSTKVKDHKPVPWWSQELTIMRKKTTAMRRRYQKAKSNGNERELRKQQYIQEKRRYESSIKRAKYESWRHYCNVTTSANP
ncbi:hypothetical protein ANN_07466 [Periplaneta americana]|uniref:Peptidase S1 domain-containing protein n=1 Tax=Periplaneta americana TaxID=6978 RepID=A0ABQ8SYP3_PERAM|nr:hypothetical protein ANN_07466 [Periplaneta americana]